MSWPPAENEKPGGALLADHERHGVDSAELGNLDDQLAT
jgi:hypothetical protein